MFLCMCLATMFEATKTGNAEDCRNSLNNALAHFCINEDPAISFFAKSLYLMSSRALKQLRLLELTHNDIKLDVI